MPFTSACEPSTSGFPICLWLEPIMKNCGKFCLMLLYIWNCNFMCTNAFSHRGEILNFCGWWTKSSKILCESAKYESYWGNLITEIICNCINSSLFFILVWLHCIAFFLYKNDRLYHPYHTEIKTWIQLADVLVRCTGILLRLDKFWWVCSVHKCHAKSLPFGNTDLLS